MSTKLKAVKPVGVPDTGPEAPPEFSEELPPLQVDPTSFDARMAGVEPSSVVRELSKHWSSVAAYEVEQEQRQLRRDGEEPLDSVAEDDRRGKLWRAKWEPKTDDELEEHVLLIKRKAAHFIDWGDIGTLWNASPRDAIELWRAVRLEARDEFVSGHYGARAFESADYMHEAWRRAQYLAIRDGLIEEWRPRGASEFILIDQMTQSYVMQMHWTEEAMRRAQTEPRVESYDYRKWREYRRVEAKANQWEAGHWDVPYQHQAEAVEQAFRLVEMCSKAFQRAARQLANIRLVRAKTARTRRRDKIRNLKPRGFNFEVQHKLERFRTGVNHHPRPNFFCILQILILTSRATSALASSCVLHFKVESTYTDKLQGSSETPTSFFVERFYRCN